MKKLFLILLVLASSTLCFADEIKAEGPAASPTVDDTEKNKDEVLPTYEQIDNASEKKIDFSWGSVFYTSKTNNHSEKQQTHLNISFKCKEDKNGKPGIKSKPHRFEFCGYSKSEINTKERDLIIKELKELPEYKDKSDAEMLEVYSQQYNDRIVDPVWNILENKSANGAVSVDITVLLKSGKFGACEAGITKLNLPTDCKSK